MQDYLYSRLLDWYLGARRNVHYQGGCWYEGHCAIQVHYETCKTCIACDSLFEGVLGPVLCAKTCGVLIFDMTVRAGDTIDVIDRSE